MSQFFAQYPSTPVSISAIGANGATNPATSIQIGGHSPSNTLLPINVDALGNLIVSPLTTSSVVKAQLQDNNGAAVVLGQALMATSLPVTIASDQSALSVAQSGTWTTGRTWSLLNSTDSVNSVQSGAWSVTATQATGSNLHVQVDNFPATQPVSGTVTANQGTANSAANGWPVKPTDGTNSQTFTAGGAGNVNILGPLGQAAAASSLSVALANEDVQDMAVTGAAAQTATVNNILTVASGSAATDLIGYRSFSVQVVSTGTGGTFIFEGSNDNTSFVAVPVFNQLILTGTPIIAAITASSSQIIYQGASHYRYLRLRIATTITGGSIQAFSKFSQQGFSPSVNEIAQATAANLNATVTATNLSTNIAQINAVTPLMGNGVTGTGSLRVTLASDTTSNTNPLLVTQNGYAKSNAPVTIASYSAANVTTAAYTQLVASTTSATKQIQIFDSSGQAMIIATGAAASEVDQIYVPPGGGTFNLAIAASTRVSIKALTATANSGYFIIDFLG